MYLSFVSQPSVEIIYFEARLPYSNDFSFSFIAHVLHFAFMPSHGSVTLVFRFFRYSLLLSDIQNFLPT